MKNLRQLGLACNQNITDQGIDTLAAAKDLVSLDLKDTQITDKGLMSLLKAQKLQFVNVSGCAHITRQALKDFQRRKPSCTVEISIN
jgi:hypothetical protein